MSWTPPDEGRWAPEDAESWKQGADPDPTDRFSWLESAFDDVLDGEEAEEAESVDVSDEAILQGIVEHRGTAVAREYVSLLALPGLEDPDAWETRFLLARLREFSQRHGLTPDERLYILEEILDGIDLEVGKRDPMYFELEAAMEECQRRHDSRAYEDPVREREWEEFKRLESMWCRIIDGQVAVWLEDLGETELAPMYRVDHQVREAHVRRGEALLCGGVHQSPYGWG
jgi:hypothetical protein